MGDSEKYGFWGRKILCAFLIFLLLSVVRGGVAFGDGTGSSDVSEEVRKKRLDEIKKALDKDDSLLNEPIERKSSASETGQMQGTESGKTESGTSEEKQQPEQTQGPEGQKPPPVEEEVSEPVPEEARFEYAVLENFNWEASEKKIILRLLVSGEGVPAVDVIKDEQGMKMRLRPKNLATRLPRALSGFPPGVQSFSILEDPKLDKEWGLEAPYYAIDEMLVSFSLPVQYSLHQEPGALKITFLLPKKIEPKKEEPVPTPSIETIVSMQREALLLPETTRGTSYQSETQLGNQVLYGALKPPSITDLYKKELENIEFRSASVLPDNVRPLLESRHPPFGTAEYFKKYFRGNIRQTFNFASNYNQGVTSAFQESVSDRGAPERGKNIGNIIGTPAVSLLFYRPGAFDFSTGYSASRDFPMMNNNFVYGLERQNINLGIGHYPDKRYAFNIQNNLRFFGGMTRQKIDGKWIKRPSQTQQGYQLDNNMGLNYRLSKRLIWGSGGGLSRTRSETKTPGGRSRDLMGLLNTYFTYRLTPRLDLLLGTDFTHVFKDTSGGQSSSLGGRTIITTKGKNVQSVFLTAAYRYSKRITLRGTFQGSLIDWDIGKIGGSVQIAYQRTPHDDFSFQFNSSVIQNNTDKIINRAPVTNGARGIQLQRFESMSLKYNRQFDRGRTRGSLEVIYLKDSPLSGVFYGTNATSTISYDIRFIASIRRAVMKNRAWLGLLYSYEYAPNTIRNDSTGEHDFTSNTSQCIIASMDYQF